MSGVAAAEWAASRHVVAGGERIRYREAGRGPPIVLVHGLGVSADYWFRNGSALARRGFRVLAPDLPGFGRSSAGRAAESPAAQAAALDAWAAALRLPPAVWVGHSLSCQSVLELAAHTPTRVAGLVLAAPTGAGRAPHRVRQLTRLALDAPREAPGLIAAVAASYLRAGPLRVLRTWWHGARHDPLALLPRVGAPAIVVVGGRDPVVEPGFAERLADGLPDGRVERIDDGTHALHHASSDAFNRLVAEFAARRFRAPRPPG